MTKRAEKKLKNLESKFTGPNAGLVWGIWPVWFADPEHPFHWAGVYHDLEYLLREMPVQTLKAEVGARAIFIGYWESAECFAYLQDRTRVASDGYSLKSREEVDHELLTNMLEAAGDDKKLILTAHIAYRVVRLLGGFYW